MTRITILKKNGIIFGYKIKGHSNFASFGQDIVCSAISTASQMTLAGLEEICNFNLEKTIKDGFMQVILDFQDAQKKEAQILLKTLKLTLGTLEKNYAKNVKLEVKEDVY